MNPWPEYINTQFRMCNKLKAEHCILAGTAEKGSKSVKVTLPDSKQVGAAS